MKTEKQKNDLILKCGFKTYFVLTSNTGGFSTVAVGLFADFFKDVPEDNSRDTFQMYLGENVFNIPANAFPFFLLDAHIKNLQSLAEDQSTILIKDEDGERSTLFFPKRWKPETEHLLSWMLSKDDLYYREDGRWHPMTPNDSGTLG
jgi:hypothetical protein